MPGSAAVITMTGIGAYKTLGADRSPLDRARSSPPPSPSPANPAASLRQENGTHPASSAPNHRFGAGQGVTRFVQSGPLIHSRKSSPPRGTSGLIDFLGLDHRSAHECPQGNAPFASMQRPLISATWRRPQAWARPPNARVATERGPRPLPSSDPAPKAALVCPSAPRGAEPLWPPASPPWGEGVLGSPMEDIAGAGRSARGNLP